MQHLTSLLLPLLCVGTATTTYTISTANRLTIQTTTTALPKIQLTELLDRSNWTLNSEGFFRCDSEEKAVSNCDLLILLGVNNNLFSQENQHISSVLKGLGVYALEVLGQLQEVRAELHTRKQRSVKAARAFDGVQNATCEILFELDTLRGRQAVAATIQVVQLLLFLAYLVVQVFVYVVKKCKKHHARKVEEEIEMMESRLMQRKSKRRAAAATKTAQATQ